MEILSVKFCPDTSIRNALSPNSLQQRESHDSASSMTTASFSSSSSSSTPLAGINHGALISNAADIFLSGICQASASTSSLWKNFSESVGNGMVQGQR